MLWDVPNRYSSYDMAAVNSCSLGGCKGTDTGDYPSIIKYPYSKLYDMIYNLLKWAHEYMLWSCTTVRASVINQLIINKDLKLI